MSANQSSFVIPPGCPDIVTLGRQLWGDPTKQTKTEIRFGSHESKVIRPFPANTWYDHETNTGGGYLDLYKLKFGTLPAKPDFPIPPGMAKELGEPVAWWDYHDADGRTVARVARFQPPGKEKTYRQCRPNGDTWRWKMEGLQIPLYHLPDLLCAPAGNTVHITEGEKHADLIRSWGLVATTNAGGAKKFRPDHAAVLAPFDCVILPDNDKAGGEHADLVAAALRGAGCKSIRIAMLPGIPPKGDVIDWHRAGGTPEAFNEIVARAEAPRAETDADEIERERQSDACPTDGDWTGSAEPPPDIDDPGYIEAIEGAQSLGPVEAVIAEFNRKYMVVNEDGKAMLYAPAHDPILNRRYHHRMDFADLQKLYLNRTVRNGVDKKGEPVFNPIAQVWLRHRDRRQYLSGVTFDPSGNHDNPEILNLWQGFAIKPQPGSWERMKRHIYEVICCSKQELFDYLLNWMARLVQFPAQQGEVAIVLKGIEGTGKGTLARALLRILGQHGLTISHSKHLVGNFNAHLRDAVFLFADEAFYAGDKSHVGVLKALITEPTLTVEAKYQNAVQAPNFVHLMMASNEDWVVPASLDARRFLVLLVAATKVRNRAYFTAIWQEMESGGYEAMLHDLLHHDLTGFDVRDVPDTEGLQEQKKLSLGTSQAWWFDALHRGYVYKSKLGLEQYFGEWREAETTEVLYASYSEFAKAQNERHPMAREAFGRFMVSMGGKASKPRNAVVGEHITDVVTNQYGDTARKAVVVRKERSHGYSLGDLKAARDAFTDATKLPVEWESDGEEMS